MAAKLKAYAHLAIAHVLFIDMVGCSKLLVNEQREVVDELTRVFRKTAQFVKVKRRANIFETQWATGGGRGFFRSPEDPGKERWEICAAGETTANPRAPWWPLRAGRTRPR